MIASDVLIVACAVSVLAVYEYIEYIEVCSENFTLEQRLNKRSVQILRWKVP
jgi:hypothetical protein